MHAQHSSDEIGRVRQDVSILSNSRDFACLFEIAEGATHFVSSRCAVTQRIRDFDFIQRPIFRLLKELQDLCAQILSAVFVYLP